MSSPHQAGAVSDARGASDTAPAGASQSEAPMAGQARHPLTMRDRLYLASRLHFARGRQVPDAARISIDNVIIRLGGHLDPATGKPVQSGVVTAREASDLESATNALERVIRHDQRQGAASADDVAALAFLRRVRNAARRAGRAPR